jgi:hypothetical protein
MRRQSLAVQTPPDAMGSFYEGSVSARTIIIFYGAKCAKGNRRLLKIAAAGTELRCFGLLEDGA